jgi:hypothetical protein
MAVCLWVQDAADESKKEDSKKEVEVKVEVKEEKPKLVASDPATWPQPEAGQVVEGVKWMAKVGGVEEREGVEQGVHEW